MSFKIKGNIWFMSENHIEGWYENNIEPKESKGYKLHNEDFLICSNCGKRLVSFLVVKTDCEIAPGINKIKFIGNCPDCNSMSFVKTFERVKLYYKAVEPLKFVDTIFTENGAEQRCKIELK